MHIYEKDGIKYPSVTTILSMIDVNEDLVKLANILGFKKISMQTIKDRSLSFGTKLHSNLQYIVDSYNCTEPERESDMIIRHDIEKSIFNFKRLFQDIAFETIFTEKTLYSNEYGYAGTLDWFTKINGMNVLFDFKSSKKPHHTYKLQLGGYANLIEENTDYRIDMSGIIICNANGASLHPIGRDDLLYYNALFCKLSEFYKMYYDAPLQDTYDYSLVDSLKTTPINK